MQHTAELLERIEKFRGLGMTDAVILGRLQLDGYSQEIVADLLDFEDEDPKSGSPGHAKRGRSRNLRKLRTPLLALSCALFAIAVGVSLHALTRPAVVYSI